LPDGQPIRSTPFYFVEVRAVARARRLPASPKGERKIVFMLNPWCFRFGTSIALLRNTMNSKPTNKQRTLKVLSGTLIGAKRSASSRGILARAGVSNRRTSASKRLRQAGRAPIPSRNHVGITIAIFVSAMLLTTVVTWALVDPVGFVTACNTAQHKVRDCLQQHFDSAVEIVVISLLAGVKWLMEHFGH
jgi:Flp pilus assembly protein TadB